MGSKTVFLDRDGTIAPDANYCSRPEDFEVFPDAAEAVKLLNRAGFRTIVITNQSGIARGYFTEDALARIHEKMVEELSKQGARIDAIYYCPHHPDDGCQCRKPGTLLFRQAAEEHYIDFDMSFMVGDTQMDIDAGRAMGCRTVLVTTGPRQGSEVTAPADYTAGSLLEAARWIVGNDNE